jgi:hypothetical protein
MVHNPHLGEIPVSLIMANGNKVELVLRPTPRATMEIEQELARAIQPVWFMAAGGELRIEALARIVVAGVKAAGGSFEGFDPSAEKLQDPIFYTGVGKVTEAVTRFLANCANGGIPPDFLKKSEAASAPEATISIGANGSESPSASSDGASPSSGTHHGSPSEPASSG